MFENIHPAVLIGGILLVTGFIAEMVIQLMGGGKKKG